MYPFGALTFHLLGDLRSRLNWGAANTSFVERDWNTTLQGYDDRSIVVRVNDKPGGPEHLGGPGRPAGAGGAAQAEDGGAADVAPQAEAVREPGVEGGDREAGHGGSITVSWTDSVSARDETLLLGVFIG